MENTYPIGNETVLNMINHNCFDDAVAATMLQGVDLDAPICDLNGYSTTYLFEAVDANNLPAVRFLLEHGANPNYDNPKLVNSGAFFDLIMLYQEQEPKTRYEISKLFFLHGADPNLIIDYMPLYSYVLTDIHIIERETEREKQYLLDFYKLMVVLGGDYEGKPKLHHVDKSKVDEYRIEIDHYKDTGVLLDENGEIIATGL